MNEDNCLIVWKNWRIDFVVNEIGNLVITVERPLNNDLIDNQNENRPCRDILIDKDDLKVTCI